MHNPALLTKTTLILTLCMMQIIPADEGEDEDAEFYEEVCATVERGVSSGHTIDNVALEVNSLKYAQNRTFSDCVDAILPTLLEGLTLESKSKKERVGEVRGHTAVG